MFFLPFREYHVPAIWWKKSEEQETGFFLFGIQTFSTAAEEVWGQNEIVSVTNMVVAANFELDEEVLVYVQVV